eukprot:3339612-Amphidinium_carterae.1
MIEELYKESLRDFFQYLKENVAFGSTYSQVTGFFQKCSGCSAASQEAFQEEAAGSLRGPSAGATGDASIQ